MKITALLTAAVLVVFLVLGLMPVHGEEAVYDNVLRLHVLANSDSGEDQALKLLVRDAVLEYAAPRLEGCRSRDEAETAVRDMMDVLVEVAEKTVTARGFDYGVTITLDTEEYPTRTYDSLCFPSGEYLSLRVCIGEAAGKNWWCVLFPPLCNSMANVKSRSEAESEFVSVGFTPDQYKIITQTDKVTYRVRFKFLEVFEELFK